MEALEGAGGMSAVMKMMLVHIPDNADYRHRRFIFKTTVGGSQSCSKINGGPCESIFYNEFAPQLRAEGTSLPVVLQLTL